MASFQKSNLGRTLENILHKPDKINLISDMAFEAIDEDQSGTIDKIELGDVLRKVAVNMGIIQPTDNDLSALLSELDQDGDNMVSKDEFAFLIIKVLEKMQATEEETAKYMHDEIPCVANQLPLEEIDEDSITN